MYDYLISTNWPTPAFYRLIELNDSLTVYETNDEPPETIFFGNLYYFTKKSSGMRKILLKLGFLILMLGMSAISYAQFTATGTITDSDGEPLIGASVQIRNTSDGTVTDLDGNFSIEVPGQSAVLEIAYLGYVTSEVTVTRSNNRINLMMEDAATTLDEITTTRRWYGT